MNDTRMPGILRRLEAPHAAESGVRLQTQVLLRWLAITGQLAAVVIVYAGLGFSLPLGLCLLAISASAWLNIFLSLRYRATIRLPDAQAAAYFAFDLLQLAVLIYLTGGLGNPFALLFLVPVTISATTLSLRSTILLILLSVACITYLAYFHLPLPWYQGAGYEVPFLYLIGIWTAILLGLLFMATYAWRISQESKRMSAALAATQLVLAREQRLSALDGLAAAAAHELGTPLGTIALVAKELQKAPPEAADQLREDLALLHSQAERCKEILSRLTRRPDEGDAVHAQLSLTVLLDELAAPHRDFDIEFAIKVAPLVSGAAPEPNLIRHPEIMYGLANFIDNAADFARSRVTLYGGYDDNLVEVRIEDDGPGLSPEIIDRLGDPYVTTRPRLAPGVPDPEEGHEGMGLGIFIAKTLLARTGATVNFSNRSDGKSGAIVTIRWPRVAVEMAPRQVEPGAAAG